MDAGPGMHISLDRRGCKFAVFVAEALGVEMVSRTPTRMELRVAEQLLGVEQSLITDFGSSSGMYFHLRVDGEASRGRLFLRGVGTARGDSG